MTSSRSAVCADRSTGSVSSVPLSGAPLSLNRPITASCVSTLCAFHASRSIRIRRTATYDPPRSHSGCVSADQTTSSNSGSAAARLAVPSTCPIRLRRVGEENPRCHHRTVVTSAAAATRCRAAVAAITASSAPTCRNTSPPVQRFSSWSLLNAGRSASPSGCMAFIPNAGRKPGPIPHVAVRRAGVAKRSASAVCVNMPETMAVHCWNTSRTSPGLPVVRSSATTSTRA